MDIEAKSGPKVPHWLKKVHIPESISQHAYLGSLAPVLLQTMQEQSSQSYGTMYCLLLIGGGLALGAGIMRYRKMHRARSDSDIIPYTPYTREEMLGYNPEKYAQQYLAEVVRELNEGETTISHVERILTQGKLNDPNKPALFRARQQIAEGLQGLIQGYNKSGDWFL